jgi:hypothetical protein
MTDPEQRPGENSSCTGKPRPATLVARSRYGWLVMGHTRKRNFRDGTPRIPVPNAAAVGLNGPGFLWGDGLTEIPAHAVLEHLGWADRDLAEVIIDVTGIHGRWANDLRNAANEHEGQG